MLAAKGGTYYVLGDNGFGRRDNSADFILSIYRIEPDFRTAAGNSKPGNGAIHVEQIIRLSDPERHMPYTIVRSADRLLTGSDLDPESFRLAVDGSYWIGEEFNPSLLHFSPGGKLLAPPYTLAGLASIDNPMKMPATLPPSRGFEGMAQSPDGKLLYPMLEGRLLSGPPGLNVYTFDTRAQSFQNPDATQPSYRYRLDDGATAIGDFTLYSATAGLVIERDSKQGKEAVIKKIYRINFNQLDPEGFLLKTLVVDLLDIADPHDLNLDGNMHFTFPYWTIEGLVVIDSETLAVINDNNYPQGSAREGRGTEPDNSELILISIDPLWP